MKNFHSHPIFVKYNTLYKDIYIFGTINIILSLSKSLNFSYNEVCILLFVGVVIIIFIIIIIIIIIMMMIIEK